MIHTILDVLREVERQINEGATVIVMRPEMWLSFCYLTTVSGGEPNPAYLVLGMPIKLSELKEGT